jgi:hypothetical protein
MVIPSLIKLLNGDHHYILSGTVSALSKLADNGEFVVVHYPGIANVDMKSNFATKLGRPFPHLLGC